MSPTIRPRRSALYMPASNQRALDKAKTLSADVLIFDLEDAVAPDAKDLAREQAVQALAAGGFGQREIIVRINALSTPWGVVDAQAVARSGAQGVALPKVESADMLRQVLNLLTDAGAPDDLGLWAMVETPRGVLAAHEIAAATPRLTGLIMGTSDLAKDLRCAHTPDRQPLLTSLSLCLLAARANGLCILDGVHLDLDDMEGFTLSCQQGRDLGFDGKTLIHPKTITLANEIFAPAATDVAWAEKIIAAHTEATAAGKGVVVVDGRLVENLHVERARQVVALSQAIAALSPS